MAIPDRREHQNRKDQDQTGSSSRTSRSNENRRRPEDIRSFICKPQRKSRRLPVAGRPVRTLPKTPTDHPSQTLFDGRLHCCRVGKYPAQDLRCDQQCRNDSRQAYEPAKAKSPPRRSQEESRLPEPASVHPMCGLLTACQDLVCIGRPGYREQRQD